MEVKCTYSFTYIGYNPSFITKPWFLYNRIQRFYEPQFLSGVDMAA